MCANGLLTVRLSLEMLGLFWCNTVLEFRLSPCPGGELAGSTQFLQPIHLHIAEHAILA